MTSIPKILSTVNISSELLEDHFERRVKSLLNDLDINLLGIGSFYIAGSSLNPSKPRDIDIFPVGPDDFEFYLLQLRKKHNKKIISKTKNALTLKIKDSIIQLCNYHHKSLKDLVESFDYAHVKIGALVEYWNNQILVKQIYISPDYITARTTGKTSFTGSDYPLSSLIRLFKYYNRSDHLLGNQFIFETIKILTSIINRGFTGYDDFKDQLDAVNLGLLPEKIEELGEGNTLVNLYYLLLKDK